MPKKRKSHFILGTIWYTLFPPLLVESHIKRSEYLPSAIRKAEPGLSRSSCFAFHWVNCPLDSKVSLLLKDLLQVSKRRQCISHNSFAYLVLPKHAEFYFLILYGWCYHLSQLLGTVERYSCIPMMPDCIILLLSKHKRELLSISAFPESLRLSPSPASKWAVLSLGIILLLLPFKKPDCP